MGAVLARELGESLGVGGEELFEDDLVLLLVVQRLELLPALVLWDGSTEARAGQRRDSLDASVPGMVV